jgi:SAM-dependent MidA family methyltransferase
MITPIESNDNLKLYELIKNEIETAGGHISFARFMELALYAPGEGYYTSRTGLVGRDFYTAPHLTAAFGKLIARQLIEFWERLGKPQNFQLVEMGAGQGLLASDILSTLYQNEEKNLWNNLSYTIVERSAALREGQRRRLLAVPDGSILLEKVIWRDLNEFEVGSIQGCFFSNELVDAFPVHLIEIKDGNWQEIYVKLNSHGQFEEESGPLSNPALNDYFGLVGLEPSDYTNGYRTEINLAALDWMKMVAQILHKGYILTIDYGYLAEHRYHPRRSAGTLQTYYQNRRGDNPYLNLGRQDLTTHVDFTALIKTGENAGLKTEGFTTQAAFLAGLGIGELFTSLATAMDRDPKELLTERNALQTLINPVEMGNFGVLIQSKNLEINSKPLAGLSLQI